jgi:hypothetical protein
LKSALVSVCAKEIQILHSKTNADSNIILILFFIEYIPIKLKCIIKE